MSKKLPVLMVLMCLFVACADNAIVDTNMAISDRNWSYNKKVRIPVTIDDPQIPYNLYFNLRHTGEYKYSNIFVLIHESGPDKKRKTERREFQLAYPDGEWLGSGSGNMNSYQMVFREGYKFPKKGTYLFEIEQNMRDNPLREISDVGLRVEPVR